MGLSTFLRTISAYLQTGTAKSSDASDAEENTPAGANETSESAQNVSEKTPTTEGHWMTEAEAKKRLVNWCRSQVGYHEALDGSNKYADGVWDAKLYGFDAKRVPWCDVFADYAYIHCFGYDAATRMTFQQPNGYAACELSAEAYSQNGAYFKDPEVGDQIFFYAGGGINHTGIVVSVDGETIQCVEGNYSDSVSLTKYNTRNQWVIAGYGRPDWGVVTGGTCAGDACDLEPSHPVCDKEMWAALAGEMPDVHYGNIGNAVKALQAMLNVLGAKIDADGEYGELTEQAIQNYKGGGYNV